MDQAVSVPANAGPIAQALLSAVKVKDPLTYAHCVRVGRSAKLFAKLLGLNPYKQEFALYTGLLHDIGKIVIPIETLHKPGKLTPQEMDLVKRHADVSAEMLAPFVSDPFFAEVQTAVLHHHERFDGQGYPSGLSGSKIPYMSRLVLIVDTFDAMTQSRTYRSGLPVEAFLDELDRFKGRQFDPDLAQMFQELFPSWDQNYVEAIESWDTVFIPFAA